MHVKALGRAFHATILLLCATQMGGGSTIYRSLRDIAATVSSKAMAFPNRSIVEGVF
ncbi:hypothetical protein LTR53_019367, partial [Teratosphaeriaceae sp. CCFEE 6253]